MLQNKKIRFLLWSIFILIISYVLVLLWIDWPIIGLIVGGVLGIINIILFYFISKKINAKIENTSLLFILKILIIIAIHYILFFGYLFLFKPN